MARRFGYFHLIAALIVGLAAGVTVMMFFPIFGLIRGVFRERNARTASRYDSHRLCPMQATPRIKVVPMPKGPPW
jgi:hypothetical protein